MPQIVSNFSWYYVQSQKLLCIGPAGFGQASDWYELEPANPYLERGHCVETQNFPPDKNGVGTPGKSTCYAMQHHAQEIRTRWKIPPEATQRLEVPYDPAKTK